jgi:uncharacterized protein (DUF427 family)
MPRAIWNDAVIAEADETVIVDGEVNPAAGWTYPDPTVAAKRIAGHVAFWRGITVEP